MLGDLLIVLCSRIADPRKADSMPRLFPSQQHVVSWCSCQRLGGVFLLVLIVEGLLGMRAVPGWAEVESRESEAVRREERWLQKQDFWQRVGFNGRTKQFTPPYSEAQLALLMDESRTADVARRVHALELLTYMLRQGAVPAEVREKRIAPFITEQSAGPLKAENEEAAQVTESAQRVLWHLKVQEISDEPERREFLQEYIIPSNDYYYVFEAIHYLVAMENEEAKATLATALELASQRVVINDKLWNSGRDEDVLRRLRNSITKLDILFSLRGLDTVAQVVYLKQAIAQHKDDYFLVERGDDILGVWLMRRLAALAHPDVIPFLRALWQDQWRDQSYKPVYSDEARDLLEEINGLLPAERAVPRIH